MSWPLMMARSTMANAAFTDEGISGAKGRDSRPGFNALHNAIARKEIDMVAAWSVDRLGRSLQDLVMFLGELHDKGIGLFLLKQGLDTSTPSGRAMFGMLSVFSEFERAMIQERVHAGLSRARANGKTLGRPKTLTPKQAAHIRTLRADGMSFREIAKKTEQSLGAVQRALNVR